MSDIAPELYKNILDEFESRMQQDKKIKQILKKIENEKADFADIYQYADRIGEVGSAVLVGYLTVDNLPDGVLYWNIAQRTVKPLLDYIYSLINEAAAAVQKTIDATEGFRVNPVSGEYPDDRVNDLIQKIVDMSIKENEEHGKPTDE